MKIRTMWDRMRVNRVARLLFRLALVASVNVGVSFGSAHSAPLWYYIVVDLVLFTILGRYEIAWEKRQSAKEKEK